jgi:thymidylate kinase
MLITVSGLDGSGKSTLIDWLKETLEKDNRKVIVSHMYYDVGVFGTFRRLLERTTIGNSGRSNARLEQSQASPTRQEKTLKNRILRLRHKVIWNKQLRLLLYPIDIFIFVWYRFYVETLGKQILIMDRYFYDTLADLTENQKSNRGRVLSRLVPKPDLPIYLEISPEAAFARKGEFSVARLNRRWLSYQKLTGWIPELVVLFIEQDPKITRDSLTRLVHDRMVAHR